MGQRRYQSRIIGIDKATKTFTAQVEVTNDEGIMIEQYTGEWHYDDYYERTGVMYDFENYEMVSNMNHLYRASEFFGLNMTVYIGSVGRWTL